MPTVKDYQYQDFLVRSQDQYANTKYGILLDYLHGQPSLDILNAGCGSGELSFLLAAAGHQVTGIDPVPDYIDLAWKNAAACGDSRCFFRVSSIEDFQASRTFDCVIATDVLEHIEDDVAAFEKLAGMVRPGGIILITVPAGQWLFGYHDVSLGHFRRYDRPMLRKLVEPWCAVESMRYFGFSLIPVCYLYSKIMQRPYPVGESGDGAKNPFRTAVLRTLLQFDKWVPAPFGTSLLMKGYRI